MIAWFTLSEMKRRKNKLLKILACSRYLNFWQHVPSNSSLLIQPKAILRTLSRIPFLEGLHSLLVFPWQEFTLMTLWKKGPENHPDTNGKQVVVKGALSVPKWTTNNQKITRIYYCQPRAKKHVLPEQPIFQTFQPDHA
jgi:hypothetical protein